VESAVFNERDEYLKKAVPSTALNISVAVVAYTTTVLSLVLASRAPNLWIAIGYALIFTLANSCIFSLLHESVHKLFSRNLKINEFFGIFSAAFFPTAFTLQRGFHLGHHRRNRTDAEMFDLYYPSDAKVFKFVQWYSLFTGFYWLSVAFTAFMVMIWPGFFNLPIFTSKQRFVAQTGGEAMFASIFSETHSLKMRLEVLVPIFFQIGLFYFFKLDWTRWLLCYWIFGCYWGAIQYADHAWSKRDIRHGAWNMKVSPIIRLIHLNYHYHLAHHQFPSLPWNYLGKFVDRTQPMPSFWGMYFRMWGGPKPTTEGSPEKLTREFERSLYEPQF
jgi:fatty acid desaturase